MLSDIAAPFLDLSQRLTGVAALSENFISEFIERLDAAGSGAGMRAALSVYSAMSTAEKADDEVVRRKILLNPTTAAAAQQIVLLWYAGALLTKWDDPKSLNFGTKPAHHFESLMWDVIGAHPPALSGGYFGYWHYPPEN